MLVTCASCNLRSNTFQHIAALLIRCSLSLQVIIAQDRTRQLRRIAACFMRLSTLCEVRLPSACVPWSGGHSSSRIQASQPGCAPKLLPIALPLAALLQGSEDQIHLVHLSFERMANVKEFR